MSNYPIPQATGEQVTAQNFNDFTLNPVYTYGETITAGQPLYFKASDGKVYRGDADVLESTINFVGFAIEGGNANDTKRILGPGKIVTGLTGLTAGSLYYLSNTVGTIGTARGTYYLEVGIAVSTTALLIKPATIAPDVNKFSDGSDGACVLDGTNTYAALMSKSGSVYTLIRDVYLTDLSISAGVVLKTAGFRVYGTGAANGPGTIDCSGGAGGNGVTSPSPVGAAGVAQGAGTLGAGTNGGIGVTGNNTPGTNGAAVANSICAAGGAGGAVSANAGGLGGVVTASKMGPRSKSPADDLMIETGATIAQMKGGSGGGSGAYDLNGDQGTGGGGGAGAGIIFLSFYILGSTLVVWAKGGNAGTPARNSTQASAGGSGGGGGGFIYARYHIDLGATFSVAGGTKTNGIGTFGLNGSDGAAGTLLKVQV